MAGDSGDIRRLIYGWELRRILASGGCRRSKREEGETFMWQRHCSRQIKKENREGQVCTQKLLELKVRQLVGVVELRASCSCRVHRAPTSTGLQLNRLDLPNGLGLPK
jgi:hypothetical protein